MFFSDLSVTSFPSLWITVHHWLSRMSFSIGLVSRLGVGAAQTLIWSYPCVLLPPMSIAARSSVFSLRDILLPFYKFYRHRVCLVGHVNLICNSYRWWEGFGPLPSKAPCPWVSTVVLSPPLHVSYLQKFAPEAAQEDLGLPREDWASLVA